MLDILKLGRWLPNDKMKLAAKSEARAVSTRWDVPQGKDVPKDMRDIRGRGARTAPDKNGRQGCVGERTLADDLHEGYVSEAIPVLFALIPVLGMLANVFMDEAWIRNLAILAMLPVLVFIGTACRNVMWSVAAAALGIGLPMLAQGDLGILHGLAPLTGGMGSAVPFIALGAIAVLFGGMRALRLLILCVASLAVVIVVSRLVPEFAARIVLAVPACALSWIWPASQDFERAWKLKKQGDGSKWELAGQVDAHVEGRKKQAIQAAKDDAMYPSISLGVAIGELSARWDPWAPDVGLEMVMSVINFATHMLITGATGKGKTELLKNIVSAIVRSKSCGILIMDGKGSLAMVFRRLKGYLLIDPSKCVVGLYENMTASDVSRTLRELNVNDQADNKDKMWNDEAYNLCNYSALMLEALVFTIKMAGGDDSKRQWHWTPHDHHAFASMGMEGAKAQREILPEQDRDPTIELTPEEQAKADAAKSSLLGYLDLVHTWHPEGKIGLLKDARNYFLNILPSTPDVTRGGIGTNFNSWITPLMGQRELLRWSQAETGEQVESCLHGGLVGINMPFTRYARAGQVAQAFLKNRVINEVRRRADVKDADWRSADPGATPCLAVIDEAQLVIGDADFEVAPTGRSLGFWYCICSQALESFQAVSKNANLVQAFLDSFQSRISLAASPDTVEWLSKRMGTVWKPNFSDRATVGVDIVGTAVSASRSVLYDENHPLADWMRFFRRMGGGRFHDAMTGTAHNRRSILEDMAFQQRVTAQGKVWEEVPLLNKTDFHTFTAAHGMALATVMRGGSPRRDFIKLNEHFGPLPDDICDPDFVEDETDLSALEAEARSAEVASEEEVTA